MRKLFFTFIALFVITSVVEAKCHTINIGFVSYTYGTYTVMVQEWIYSEAAGTFVQTWVAQERPCNGGDHWEWFWE